MVDVKRQWPYLSGTLLFASSVSIGLYAVGALRGYGSTYTYLLGNLILAWLPLLFIRILLRELGKRNWSSWQGIVATMLWLVFLPNSFYIVTDYIHLQLVPDSDILYVAVMITSFVLNGLILGYISLYLFHSELRRRLSSVQTKAMLAVVLLACSFAIYLGRYLRWNTWDVVLDPAGVLFDVSNRLISPWSYPRMILTTTVFFILLSSMYVVMYNVVRYLRTPQRL